MKHIDETIHFLKSNPFLQDVGTLNMRKYASFFIKTLIVLDINRFVSENCLYYVARLQNIWFCVVNSSSRRDLVSFSNKL